MKNAANGVLPPGYSMRSKLREARFRILTLGFGLGFAAFIIASLICVITHTTHQALWESLTSKEIHFALRMSLITSAISTAICILVSVPAAYAMTRYRFFGKTFLNAVMDAPLALPPLVAGLALLILFGTTSFGEWLSGAGLDFVFSAKGIVLAQFFVNMPFMYRIMRSTFESINPRYEYVAQTLGCTEAQSFRRVTLPMSRNGLVAGTVITWSRI